MWVHEHSFITFLFIRIFVHRVYISSVSLIMRQKFRKQFKNKRPSGEGNKSDNDNKNTGRFCSFSLIYPFWNCRWTSVPISFWARIISKVTFRKLYTPNKFVFSFFFSFQDLKKIIMNLITFQISLYLRDGDQKLIRLHF